MNDISDAAANRPPADTSSATWQLAHCAASAKLSDFPPAVVARAVRALVNRVGCVLGASRHVAVTCAREALDRYSGPEEVTVLGSGARCVMMRAALVV